MTPEGVSRLPPGDVAAGLPDVLYIVDAIRGLWVPVPDEEVQMSTERRGGEQPLAVRALFVLGSNVLGDLLLFFLRRVGHPCDGSNVRERSSYGTER